MKRATPEADLQREVVRVLRLVLPRGSIVHHSANEARRGGRAAQGIALGMGIHPGFADLIVLACGRVLFLELKSRTGSLSESQREFRVDVLAQGFGWARVRRIEDAIAACREAGIPLRIREGL